MKIQTRNVVVVNMNSHVSAVHTFNNDTNGNINALDLFRELAKEQGCKDEEMSQAIDEGAYCGNCDSIFLITSED